MSRRRLAQNRSVGLSVVEVIRLKRAEGFRQMIAERSCCDPAVAL
jgi:hypothetical protein